jgi:lipid-binding SYLF domain-containing protein
MKQTSRTLLFVLLFTSLVSTAWADKYSDTMKMFSDAGIADMFESAYGYAIFPTIGKGGVVVGAAYGEGRVYEQKKYVGDTKMGQASVGFQIGASGFSQVIFFEDKRAFEEFTGDSFEFGAEMSAVALTAAANVSGKTGGSSATASGGKNNATAKGPGYHKGMATYTITKGGAMVEASVSGQAFNFTKLVE